jgi:epsilon-lactone hydrolase
MVSTAAERMIEQMRAQMGGPLPSLEEERSSWEAYAKGDKLPEGTLVSGVSLNGVDCEWVGRDDSDGGVLMLVHGGGYNAGSPRTHRKFAATLAKASRHRVLVPDYRLAPESPYPAGLEDVIAVYAAIIEEGADPGSIAFVGDSAGGGLALAAVVQLRDLGAPLPRALVLLSPWLDLTLSGESLDRNAIHPNPSEAELRRAAAWYAGAANAAEPLISPLFADLGGLPPVLAQAGGHDVLLDDAVRVVEQVRAAGGKATLSVAPGLWHGFQMADCLEARAAVEEAVAFVDNAQPADAVA